MSVYRDIAADMYCAEGIAVYLAHKSEVVATLTLQFEHLARLPEARILIAAHEGDCYHSCGWAGYEDDSSRRKTSKSGNLEAIHRALRNSHSDSHSSQVLRESGGF